MTEVTSHPGMVAAGPTKAPGDFAIRMRRSAEYLAIPLLALTISAVFFSIFLVAVGKSPAQFYALVYQGGFGTAFSIQNTLQRSAPLIFTALAVAIPAVVFTDPELAWCGITEAEAKAAGKEVVVAKFPWAASGRAQTIGRTEGLTKMIVEPKTERILGVGIVGPGAGELIAEGVLAVETAAVARDLAETIHAHPTLSEAVKEATEVAAGHAIHI